MSIIGTGTFALQEQTGGSATLTNVTATGVAQANLGNDPSYSCEGTAFTLTETNVSGVDPAGLQSRRRTDPGLPAVPRHRRQREPDGADVQPDRGRQHQRRADA